MYDGGYLCTCSCTIEDKRFDLYAFNTDIENVLKNQLLDEKRINKVILVRKKLIYNAA